jgi:hypothetical protein
MKDEGLSVRVNEQIHSTQFIPPPSSFLESLISEV